MQRTTPRTIVLYVDGFNEAGQLDVVWRGARTTARPVPPPDDQPGGTARQGAGAGERRRRHTRPLLLVRPLSATTLIEHMRWFLGWDTEKMDPAATRMEAHVPYNYHSDIERYMTRRTC
jgi:hypothetical protein